jgi:hypothetical protein
VKGFPTDQQIRALGFHLVFDKAKFDITNVVWDTDVLDQVAKVSEANGVDLGGARNEAAGNVSASKALVTFKITPKVTSLTPGTYTFGPDVSDTENTKLKDMADKVYTDAAWNPLSLTVSTGPPNPAKDLTVAAQAARQKDPVSANLNWTQGLVSILEARYRATGGAWTAITVPADAITNKKLIWTTSFAGLQKDVEVQVRALDQGKVWNGTAAVDAATNGEVGWKSATFTVDNKGPVLQSASATGSSVALSFDEALAGDPVVAVGALGNFAVNEVGGGAITVNSATLSGDGKTVTLALASALDQAKAYKASANNMADLLNNVAGNQQVDVSFKPKVLRADFVWNATEDMVDVLFSNTMTAASVNAVAGWKLSVVAGGATVALKTAALQADNKTVRLTAQAALSQNTQYKAEAPTTATDTGGKAVGTDNTATFTTPWWHSFAAGLFTVGVPLDTTARAYTTLGAAGGIARWDATLNAGAGGYQVDKDRDGDTDINLGPGIGLFAKFTAATLAFITGGTQASPTNLAVNAGWNLISDPFMNTNINIMNVKAGANSLRFAWWWDGTKYQLIASLSGLPNVVGSVTDSMLKPWVGYFVKVAAAGNLTLTTGTTEEVEPAALGGKGAMLLPLVARAGDASDLVSVCGVGSVATKIDNPPFAAGSVDLAFVNDDWATPMAVDVRTGPTTQKWNLIVKTDLPNTPVTVLAPDLSALPKDYTVVLTDVETGRKAYLRTSAGYSFTTGAEGATRRLTLEILARAQTALLSGVQAAQAGSGRVVLAYTLSGPAAVSAQIMNIAGRVIKQLAADRPETGGSHTLSWDLTNNGGSTVPRGTYLLTMAARTEDGQQVSAVSTFAVNR